MRRFLLAFCFAFLFLNSSQAQETAPIIALSEGAIYALNAEDGSAELLVPAPNAYEAMLEYVYDPITLFTSEWLSPDGQYLAYRVMYPTNPDEEINGDSRFTQQLFVLDLENPNHPISISFGERTPNIESIAWSFDGALLYVLLNNSLNIIERDNWTEHISVDVGAANSSQNPIMSRRIFATENGIVMTDGGDPSFGIEFSLFDTQGNLLNEFAVDGTIASDVNFYINTPFAAIDMDGKVQYAFVDIYGQLRVVTDFATGESTEGDYSRPAMLSRNAVDSSLRLFPMQYSGDYMALAIFDNEDNYLGDIPQVSAYAYGISGDNVGSTFALSPDGQQLAYLEDGTVMLWQAEGSRSLDFAATVIVWSAPIYLSLSPDYFRG